MADQVIGKLTLDVSNIDKSVKHVNEELAKLGAGVKVDLSNKVSAEVKKQLDSVLKEIKSYESKMSEAVNKAIENAKNKEAAAAIREQAKAEKELAQSIKEREKAQEASAKSAAKENLEKEKKALDELINLHIKKSNLETKATKAVISGNIDNVNMYLREAQSVQNLIDAKAKLHPILEQEAQANEKVAAAELKRIDAANTARKKSEDNNLKAQTEQLNAYSEALVKLYQRKSAMDAEATKAIASGNMDNANMYLREEQNIEHIIDAMAKLHPELDKVAQADARVAEAEMKRVAAANNAKQKAAEIDYKNQAESVNAYAEALVNLYNRQTELNNAMAKGTVQQGTAVYDDMKAAVARAGEVAGEAGRQLQQMGIDANEAVAGMSSVTRAAEQLQISEDRLAGADVNNYLGRVKQSYFELTDAIKNYKTAQRENDTTGMADAQARIDLAMQEVGAIQEAVSNSQLEASAKQQVLNYIQQCVTAEHEHASASQNVVTSQGELGMAVKSLVTRYFSLLAVIRTIKTILSDSVEYVTQYSDKMNEIQIITGKSNNEIQELGERYMKIAEQMSVSSLDMADAAIYFTRQGLNAEEIESRLKNVTMYAKTANIEFTESAEIMTAVINSLKLVEQEEKDGRDSAQRVADVFLAIGDNAATSGYEIGEAMQKAAASAGAFGVEFEWLSASIAAVSETTRQEARTIGTAFNTIIARLHQIKQNGYNSEDETKINDVAKALGKIDVVLMDQAGNWRDYQDIMTDVSKVWNTLDDKTKSYIATTMAGVKQQNVFLAWMNDMSKGVENGSRTWELYAKAMDSAGTAGEKYATYMDSIEAAQNKLTIAQEKFYSTLQASVIKDWYSSLAGIVDWITRGTTAMKGMNLTVPLIITGITLLVTAFVKLSAGIQKAGSAMKFFTGAMQSHPIIAAITILTTLIGVLTAVGSAAGSNAQRFEEATAAVEESNSKIKNYLSLQEQLNQMFASFDGEITSDNLAEYESLLGELANVSPKAKNAIQALKEGMMDQAEVARILNEEMEKVLENEQKIALSNLKKRYQNYDRNTLHADLISNWSGYAEDYTNKGFSTNSAYVYGLRDYMTYLGNKYYGGGGFIAEGLGSNNPDIQNYKLLHDIEQQVNQLGYDEFDKWTVIAEQAMNDMFGTVDITNPWTAMFQTIDEEVDYVINNIDSKLDEFSKMSLREQLYNAILGGDDELSYQEYSQMYSTIYQFIDEYSKGLIEVSQEGKLRGLVKSILGTDTAVDVYSAEIKNLANTPWIIDEIASAYQEIQEAGILEYKRRGKTELGGAMLYEFLFGSSIADWSSMVDSMKLELMRDMTNGNYTDLFFNTDENGNRVSNGQKWGDVDLKTLRLAADLVNENVLSVEQLKSIMAENSDLKEFAGIIASIAESAGLISENSEEVDNSFDTLTKKIKETQTDMKTLDDFFTKVSNHEDLNISDMFDIMGSHSELLLLIGDIDLLKEAIDSIKKDKVDSIISDLFNMWSNDENIKSQYTDPDELRKKVNAMVVAALYQSGILDEDNYHAQDSDFILAVEEFRTQLIDNLRKRLGRMLLHSEEEFNVDTGEWDEGMDFMSGLTFETLKLIDTLSQGGTTLEEFNKLWEESGYNEEKFVESLKNSGEETEDTTEETKTYIDTIKDLITEYDKMSKLLDSIESNGTISPNDLLDLVKAHPELREYIGDLDMLQQKIKEIKQSKVSEIATTFMNELYNDKDFLAKSPLSQYQDEKHQTIFDILNDVDNLSEDVESEVKAYMNLIYTSFLHNSGMLENVGQEMLEELMSGMFSGANSDLTKRKIVEAKEMIAAGWTEFEDEYATVYSGSFTTSNTGREDAIPWNQNVVFTFTPITEGGRPLGPDEFNEYVENLLSKSKTIEQVIDADKKDRKLFLHYTVVTDTDEESFQNAISYEEAFAQALHYIHELLYQNPSGESWLQQQVDAMNELANANWAETNGFIEQISQLQQSMHPDDVTEELFGADAYGKEEIQRAYEVWKNYDNAMKESISKTYPGIANAMLEVEKALQSGSKTTTQFEKAGKALASALQKAEKYANAKYFKGTYDSILKLEKGTISVTDAYDAFDKELNSITKAYDEATKSQKKLDDGTKLTTNDVNDMASALGISAQEVIDDFPGALAMLDELRQAGMDAYNELNKEATMKILGISEADFSKITNGLIAVQSDAKATIALLEATGQWELVDKELPADMPVFDVVNGKTVQVGEITATGHQKILRAKNNNPFANTGGGGGGGGGDDSSGGGGGGGNKKNSMTEVERALDRMDQSNSISEYQQSYYQAQNKYYNQTGQLQGVIGYSQKEIDLIKEQSSTLEDNIKTIEDYLEKKREELAALDTSDEKYEEVADDVDKLQKAHQKYTKQLIENKTSVDQLTKAIDEQRKKIRSMEIDLRETIMKAIEDREARKKNILDAEIQMENKVLEVIQKRYEKERDQIVETTNLKIDALNKESAALDEQLQKRREMEDKEEKQKQLLELEAKYQRIIADPTRAKEAKNIQKQIDDMRKEMAWDLAEEEVNAQKDSIDQQVTSLEDYIEYVQNYYEDLFEHPQKLIEEMKQIMQMTDEEIISWLKENDDEYQKSTENTQTQLVDGWQETLDTIHDIIKTHWDEVEEIITQGDEYIIQFLKDNTEDYRKAGELQAEAYVEEWQKKLDDLKKAYEEVTTEIAGDYDVIEKPEGEGNSSGGGSGGSGGNGGNNDTPAKPEVKKYWHIHGKDPQQRETVFGKSYDTEDEAVRVGNRTLQQQGWSNLTYHYYKRGGIADYTGPAWIDATPDEPERILTARQNQLFETMVHVLEQASRISVPSMRGYGDMNFGNGSQVSVGDIIVNVDNLDTDDDYDELARKVSEILMECIGRTAVVGGMRINTI